MAESRPDAVIRHCQRASVDELRRSHREGALVRLDDKPTAWVSRNKASGVRGRGEFLDTIRATWRGFTYGCVYKIAMGLANLRLVVDSVARAP